MFSKVCKKCGKSFSSPSRNTIYCEDCRWKYQPKERKSKYSCNFFEGDIEGYSYFMGFICGDGYVHPKNGQVSWYSTDKQIVDDLTLRLGYSRTPHLNKKATERTKECYGNILYVENAKYFTDRGLCYDKADLSFDNMKNVEIRHFLRGLFDSDGSLILRKGKYENDIISTIQFLGQRRLLESLSFVLGNKVYEQRGVCAIRIGGRKAYDILHFMYDGSSIHLNRKYERFIKIKDHKFSELIL